MLVMEVWIQDDKDGPIGERLNKRIPKFVKERDLALLGDNVVPLGGIRVVYYGIDSCIKARDMYYLLLMWDSLMKVKYNKNDIV